MTRTLIAVSIVVVIEWQVKRKGIYDYLVDGWETMRLVREMFGRWWGSWEVLSRGVDEKFFERI